MNRKYQYDNKKPWSSEVFIKLVIGFGADFSDVDDFKKLRMVARKTKCKVKIKKKEGLYFTLFKYIKRKIVVFLLAMAIFFTIAFSTFVWNINVVGNDTIPKETVLECLKSSGLYVGRCKIGMDKKEIINSLRLNMQDISWAGIEIDGTLATVKVVEKTKLDDKDIQIDRIRRYSS